MFQSILMTNLKNFKGSVRLKGLVINLRKSTFTVALSVKDVGKLRYSHVGVYGGRFSIGVYRFFTDMTKSYLKTYGPDGTETYDYIGEETKFERYARLQGYTRKEGQDFANFLASISFESLNESVNYYDNPLRLIIDTNGVINMMNTVKEVPQMKFKSKDPFTNCTTTEYKEKTYVDGKGKVRATVHPSTEYRRLRVWTSNSKPVTA